MTDRYVHDQKAGNFHDVWKHFILTEYMNLQSEVSAVTYIDTHVGSFAYRNTKQDQLLTGVLNFPNGLSDLPESAYSKALNLFEAKVDKDENNQFVLTYPGSLLLSSIKLQDTNSLIIGCEINEELANRCSKNMMLLKRAFKSNLEFHCENSDGYTYAKKNINEKEGKGIVFVDPPYYPDEHVDWDSCNMLLDNLTNSWTYILWYCIYSTDPESHYGRYQSFKEKIDERAFPSIDLQLQIKPLTAQYSKSVTGILIINPGVAIDEFLKRLHNSGILKISQLLKPQSSSWGPKINVELSGC